jgi:hypothetical protein
MPFCFMPFMPDMVLMACYFLMPVTDMLSIMNMMSMSMSMAMPC